MIKAEGNKQDDPLKALFGTPLPPVSYHPRSGKTANQDGLALFSRN
jgi:hypothetical protein